MSARRSPIHSVPPSSPRKSDDCAADEEARKSDAAEFKDRIAGHQLAIEGYEENLAELEQKYHRAKRAAADLQEDLSSLHKLRAEKRSRLEVLEQLIAEGEGFEKGTQAVLKGLDDPDFYGSRVRSPLAKPDRGRGAFRRCDRGRPRAPLQTVIVSDVAVAEQVIRNPARGNLGKASVIAEGHLAAAAGVAKGRAPLGAIGWAADRVRAKAPVEALVAKLLEGVLLVEDLPTALRMREEGCTFAIATLTGEFVTAEGVIHGGAQRRRFRVRSPHADRGARIAQRRRGA